MLWRDYLRKLSEDGVQLGWSDEEAVTDEGEVVRTWTLSRWTDDGQLLWLALDREPQDDELVPPRLQRQIMNVLRLPMEKYYRGIEDPPNT